MFWMSPVHPRTSRLDEREAPEIVRQFAESVLSVIVRLPHDCR